MMVGVIGVIVAAVDNKPRLSLFFEQQQSKHPWNKEQNVSNNADSYLDAQTSKGVKEGVGILYINPINLPFSLLRAFLDTTGTDKHANLPEMITHLFI
ncbi:hypothetical protein pdam_00016065 [Pocillopora damicornis]|uniref:Uncharacterized protein n=1 Tax=Pocillopora damicornis TaxID=46731 RepID=A0A3M6TVM1_POCDA|nr:hypothetical protein pdam_00016065 [Pocillopora damicornis]